MTGPGLTIYIEQLNEELILGTSGATLSPDLLERLLNEINMYGAKHVSVAGQRVINTTVVRDINGETKINGRSLTRFPIEIIVLTEDFTVAEKLYNQMQVSKSAEEFFIDNLTVTIKKPELSITVPAFEDSIRIRGMEQVKSDKGDS